MSKRVDLFESIYGNFGEQAAEAIRRETFGRDIGQNSWPTADEYDRFISWLGLASKVYKSSSPSCTGSRASGVFLESRTSSRSTPTDAVHLGGVEWKM